MSACCTTRAPRGDARGVVALDTLARDARFAVGRLGRAWRFAAGVIATLLLVAVTLVATFLPARRAARTHPAVVLRGD